MESLINFMKAVGSLPEKAFNALASLVGKVASYIANIVHHLLDMVERRIARSPNSAMPVNYREKDAQNMQAITQQVASMSDEQLSETVSCLETVTNTLYKEVENRKNASFKPILQPLIQNKSDSAINDSMLNSNKSRKLSM